MKLGSNALLTLAPDRLVNDAWTDRGLVKPWSLLTAPGPITFVRVPFSVMVALRVNVQLPFGGRLPPPNSNSLLPGAPLKRLPPHVPGSKFTGLGRTMVEGMLSTNPIPERG